MDTILSTVNGLLGAAAKNTSVTEVAAAAAAVQGLVEQRELAGEQLTDEDIANDFAPLYEGQKAIKWKVALASCLAGFFNCHTYSQGGTLRIAGKQSDVEVASFLFGYVAGDVERLCQAGVKSDRGETGKTGAKTWANNFKLAAVETIRAALQAGRDEARAASSDEAVALAVAESESVVKWAEATFKPVAKVAVAKPAAAPAVTPTPADLTQAAPEATTQASA